ncbi:MAG: dihydrolipoyl dehydrogenase family protein [Flavobacteriales bacterium]
METHSNKKYDVCIIGGGPAGYAAAMRAIDFGKSVVLIEKNKLGGAGIYNGALTSKTMWELSRKVDTINTNLYTAGRRQLDVTWDDVQKTIKDAIFERKFQYSSHVKLLDAKLKDKFTYEKGTATMISNHEIEIKRKDDTETVIWSENIIIATGSRPRVIPNINVDEKIIMTSDGIHHMDSFPKSLVIVGAGVIGCEYATMFSSFSRTKVYLIDKADHILPFEDRDISSLVANNLKKNGVTIHNKANLERLEEIDGEVEYELAYPDGKKEVIRVEKALLSIGRVPNCEQIGMDNAGVKMSKRGRHIGDEDTQTNIPNIYAVGDVSGNMSLVNVGELEARHAVEKMFMETEPKPISYDNISNIMFLDPEVAAVGMNEKQCIEQNIPVKVVKIDYSCIARAIAMRKTEGFFKIIVTNDKEMKILGMRAIGEHASSAIQAVALLIKMDKGIDELAELIHPHPSIIEGIQECVRMLLNKSVFKSSIFKDKLKCYSCVEGVCTPLQRL